MKKAFRFFAFSFAVLALTVACNNAPEEVTDTTAEDTLAVIDTLPVDTVAQDTVAVEEPAPATTAQKTNKKKVAPKETTITLEGGATATSNNSGKLKKKNDDTPMADQNTTKVNGTPVNSAPGKLQKKQ